MRSQPAKPTLSDESICLNPTFAYLNKWRIGGLKFDVPKLFKTTFQELLLIILMSVTAVLADLLYTTYRSTRHEEEYPGSIAVPLTFFSMLIIGKVYENMALKLAFGYMAFGYTGSSAAYRVLHKIAILAVVLATNVLAVFISESVESKLLSFDGKSKLSRATAACLQVWSSLLAKFIGSCAVITFCRLYIDLGIYSYKLLTYVPPQSGDDCIERKKLGSTNGRQVSNLLDEDSNRNDANANNRAEKEYPMTANSREHLLANGYQ